VQPTYFMKAFGVNKATVTARAVATLVSQQSNTKPGCVYTLASPGAKAGSIGITVQGGTAVDAPNCGFSDNGNFTASNNVSVTAGAIGVAGSITGGATCPANCPLAQVTTPDPLSYLTPPVGSCTNLGSVTINNAQVVSFAPGTYCVSDFTVNGSATVCNSVYSPWYPATNGNCSGMPGSANSGVTFYVTGAVKINGGAQVQLLAPDSGSDAGMLFYQDPTDTSTATLSGNSSSYYQGALYFPGAELDFGGGSGATFNQGAAYTTIVASGVKFAGGPNIHINSNYSQLPNGQSMISNAVLVE